MKSSNRIATLITVVGMTGCGGMFVDTSVIDSAQARARAPGLSAQERGKIFETAGDHYSKTIRLGFAADMYFDAANEYDRYNSTAGDGDVRRVYEKCSEMGRSLIECQSIKELIIDKWGPNRVVRAGAPNRTAEGILNEGAASSAGASAPSGNRVGSAMDDAIKKAKEAMVGVPSSIDGCPTGVKHLAEKLPVCPSNSSLLKLRELGLLTDASFRADIAAGLTLAEVAKRTAQAARQYDQTLPISEKAMWEAAADGRRVQARLDSLKQIPSRCDAGPPDAFGMQEQAYQAHVASFMAAQINRAVSVIAACRARMAK